MFSEFAIRNLRSIEFLELRDLGRITLLTGMNEAGKTTVLEGFFLNAGGPNAGLAVTVNVIRGIIAEQLEIGKGGEEFWESLFRDFRIDSEIELSGKWNGELRAIRIGAAVPAGSQVRIDSGSASTGEVTPNAAARALQVTVVEGKDGTEKTYTLRMVPPSATVEPQPPAPEFQGFFQHSKTVGSGPQELSRFGQLRIRKLDRGVLDALRIVAPEARAIDTPVTSGVPGIHVDMGQERLIPLQLLGDGAVRVFWLAVNILTAQNGILMVDEIENGIHYSVMSKVWRAVDELSRQTGAQVVASTHSRECARAAYEVFADQLVPEDNAFRLIRLERDGSNVRAFSYDREALAGAFKGGLEVR